jgi:hypothetical protein
MAHHFKAELRQKPTKLQGELSLEIGRKDQPQSASIDIGRSPKWRGFPVRVKSYCTHPTQAGQACRGKRERGGMSHYDRSGQRLGAREPNLAAAPEGLLNLRKLAAVPASAGHTQAHSAADPVHEAPVSFRRNTTTTFPAGSTMILFDRAR